MQLSAQQATLLSDIKPGIAKGIESDAAIAVGGNYFFHGKTDAEGQELWVTDGTSAFSSGIYIISFYGDVNEVSKVLISH